MVLQGKTHTSQGPRPYRFGPKRKEGGGCTARGKERGGGAVVPMGKSITHMFVVRGVAHSSMSKRGRGGDSGKKKDMQGGKKGPTFAAMEKVLPVGKWKDNKKKGGGGVFQ